MQVALLRGHGTRSVDTYRSLAALAWKISQQFRVGHGAVFRDQIKGQVGGQPDHILAARQAVQHPGERAHSIECDHGAALDVIADLEIGERLYRQAGLRNTGRYTSPASRPVRHAMGFRRWRSRLESLFLGSEILDGCEEHLRIAGELLQHAYA